MWCCDDGYYSWAYGGWLPGVWWWLPMLDGYALLILYDITTAFNRDQYHNLSLSVGFYLGYTYSVIIINTVDIVYVFLYFYIKMMRNTVVSSSWFRGLIANSPHLGSRPKIFLEYQGGLKSYPRQQCYRSQIVLCFGLSSICNPKLICVFCFCVTVDNYLVPILTFSGFVVFPTISDY